MANYTQPGVTLLRTSEPVTLTATFTDLAAATVDPGATTLTVTKDDDTALVTAAAASGTGATARTYVLTATHTATLRESVPTACELSRIAPSEPVSPAPPASGPIHSRSHSAATM